MNTEILLEDNTESYYWMGFLLADGYYRPNHSICLTLADLDINHVKRLKRFLKIRNPIMSIKTNNGHKASRLNISKISVIREILYKFDWQERKTYNPPNLSVFRKTGIIQNLCWFIGFIDGDGCIQYQPKRKDTKISIHIHPSWMKVMLFFHKLLDRYFEFKTAKPRILKSGYLRYDIANTRLVKKLKIFALSKNLPVLQRKWKKIDLTRKHKHDKANEKHKEILRLKEEGLPLKKIARKFNLTTDGLGYYLYRKKVA